MGRINFCSDCLGFVSLVWFIWLLFYRYDHYGKVCAGDYQLQENTKDLTQFKNLQTAGLYVNYYVMSLATIAGLIFLGVMVYTCVADPIERPIADEETEFAEKQN